MWKFGNAVIYLLGLMALATSGANASPIILDFEGLAAGTIVTNQYSGLGVNIDGYNQRVDNHNRAMIFDSAIPTGGDSDLKTPGAGINNNTALGNILIISEDGNSSIPDDEGARPAGYLKFSFDNKMYGGSITLVDIEEGTGTVEFSLGTTLLTLNTISLPALGDNSVQTIDFKDFEFDMVKVILGGSGSVGELVVNSNIPEPTTLALMSLGLAGIGYRRRQLIKA